VAIRWNDISLLQALGRLEGEDRAYDIDGEQLMQIFAGDERCTDPDRASLSRLLYTLSQQGRLSFEIKDDPGVAVPSAENPRHLQWLWRFKLTETGRARTRARVVPDQRPDPDEDDGRPIPGLALDRFVDAIAAWYTPEQVPKFLRNAGLPSIHKVETHGKTSDLSANLAAYEQGNSTHRYKLRRFLAAFLNDELDPFPDSAQRNQLVATLAEAGWHLKDDNLVIGERVTLAKQGATTATPEATALERDEAIARAAATERERDQALEQARVSEVARQAAEQETERVRQGVERAEQQAAAAARRAEQAETNAADALAEQRQAREQAIARAAATERERDQALEQARVSGLARQAAEQETERVRQDVERAEQHARSERIERERERGEQREARAALELERDRARAALELEQDRAQAVLESEQQLRVQLQTDLESTQRRLEAAEKARDAAIAAIAAGERPATRRSTPRRKP
jgi:hypothetical protein